VPIPLGGISGVGVGVGVDVDVDVGVGVVVTGGVVVVVCGGVVVGIVACSGAVPSLQAESISTIATR
jgi:hypothetical protein